MSDVLDLLGWRPRTRRGTQWRGPCPLHGSRSTTSRCFAVQVDQKMYQCFRCGAAGNALDLYAAATRQTIYQAALELCARLGHAVPWLQRSRPLPAEETPMSGP
jgi:DNA primase